MLIFEATRSCFGPSKCKATKGGGGCVSVGSGGRRGKGGEWVRGHRERGRKSERTNQRTYQDRVYCVPYSVYRRTVRGESEE